jgi:hypothetical protein
MSSAAAAAANAASSRARSPLATNVATGSFGSAGASFQRAVSPFASAAVRAPHAADSQSAMLYRHTALQSAATVDAVMAQLPPQFEPVLRQPFLGLADHATKLWSARSTLEEWTRHSAASTIPTCFKVGVRPLAMGGFFSSTEDGRKAIEDWNRAHDEFGRKLLADSLRAKQLEVATLEAELASSNWFPKFAKLVDARRVEVAERQRIQTWQSVPIAPDGDSPMDGRTHELRIGERSSADSTPVWREGDLLLAELPTYVFRILDIVNNRESGKANKAKAKKELHAAADGDRPAPGNAAPEERSYTDRAIAALEKRVSRMLTVSNDISQLTSLLAQQEAGRQQGHRERSRDAPQGRQGPQTVAPTSNQQKARREKQRAARRERQVVRQQQAGRFFEEDGVLDVQGGSQRQINLPSFDASDMDHFRYGVPSSLPDSILTLELPRAISIIHLYTPVLVLQAAEYKNCVHLSNGIRVPEEIQYHLSVGLRYMFAPIHDSGLIANAWVDFVKRLRWRLYFLFQGENTPYDPDYAVPNISKGNVKAPIMPDYIELGFKKGQSFVREAISKVPDLDTTDVYRRIRPRVKQVRDFLYSNNYVVTTTDKNLGLAVSERHWIIEKCQDLLNDESNYKKLTYNEFKQIQDKKCTDMLVIAEIANIYCWEEGSVAEFMRSQVTQIGKIHHAPVFYGIPKIHKVPTKMRPIIPCHSAIMNPAAKYVSKKLKPIIKSAPTIIHGTKDLAIKLSKLDLKPGHKFYIVTGDVVAFYPNIPLKRCIDVVSLLYKEYAFPNPDLLQDERSRKQLEVFMRSIVVGNTDLACIFDGTYYLQLQGLAMGVADSPDLANLYGWFFERECNVINHPQIPFYGRYIDDCLAIVYANSADEAISLLLNLIKFDGCTIEWEASASWAPFLDMALYTDNTGRLQHMPYQKARNHKERIPWISYHPLDVKRGTFIGEMSRLATLSSTLPVYKSALYDLIGLYRKRGYPYQLLYEWTQKYIEERWQKRLSVHDRSESSPPADVLVLKTEYNTAWNYFSASQLGDTLLGYWTEWLERAESQNYNSEFPRCRPHAGDVECAPQLGTSIQVLAREANEPGVLQDLGEGALGHHWYVPDFRKLKLSKARTITSRKRVRNLMDLTNLWKKEVLLGIDRSLSQDVIEPIPDIPDETSNQEEGSQQVHGIHQVLDIHVRPYHERDEEPLTMHHRSSPPAPDTWTYGRN